MNLTHGISKQTKQSSKKPTNKSTDFLTTMSVCGECSPEPLEKKLCKINNKCRVCKPYRTFSKHTRLVLHYNNKLDHTMIKKLTRKGYLPEYTPLAEKSSA